MLYLRLVSKFIRGLLGTSKLKHFYLRRQLGYLECLKNYREGQWPEISPSSHLKMSKTIQRVPVSLVPLSLEMFNHFIELTQVEIKTRGVPKS